MGEISDLILARHLYKTHYHSLGAMIYLTLATRIKNMAWRIFIFPCIKLRTLRCCTTVPLINLNTKAQMEVNETLQLA